MAKSVVVGTAEEEGVGEAAGNFAVKVADEEIVAVLDKRIAVVVVVVAAVTPDAEAVVVVAPFHSDSAGCCCCLYTSCWDCSSWES